MQLGVYVKTSNQASVSQLPSMLIMETMHLMLLTPK